MCQHLSVTSSLHNTHSCISWFLRGQSFARRRTGRFGVATLSTRTSRRTHGTFLAPSKPWWRACRDSWMVSRVHTQSDTHSHSCHVVVYSCNQSPRLVFLSTSTDGKNQLLLALLKCTGTVMCRGSTQSSSHSEPDGGR